MVLNCPKTNTKCSSLATKTSISGTTKLVDENSRSTMKLVDKLVDQY